MHPVIALGLVNWIATTILVESELFRSVREYVDRRAWDARWEWSRRVWNKARYLIRCHLCTGTWVGLVQASVFGSPWDGVTGWIAGGLLYRAVGHLVLELRPQAWVRTLIEARGKVE
jgi:hypothetical protein